MKKLKMLFMLRKPTMLDFVDAEMSKKAKTVFYASFEDAKKQQDKMLKKAKQLSR